MDVRHAGFSAPNTGFWNTESKVLEPRLGRGKTVNRDEMGVAGQWRELVQAVEDRHFVVFRREEGRTNLNGYCEIWLYMNYKRGGVVSGLGSA